jgi:transposase
MLTIGVDLGDKWSHVCILDEAGEVIEEGRVATRLQALKGRFSVLAPARVAIEAGTHSPWVQDILRACGHEVLVANSRKVRLISHNDRKQDDVDAQWLARLARLEPRLLAPIEHREARFRRDLAVLRSRRVLVNARTKLINHVRGVVKSFGGRLRAGATTKFQEHTVGRIPEDVAEALAPVIEQIGSLREQIRSYDKRIASMAHDEYPESALLMQVSGVGALTAMTFLLTIGDRSRFKDSRAIGAYLGLRPRRHQSGDVDPQLRISKTGDRELRQLLVGSAHYILGPFGPDSDLRRWGLSMAAHGKRNAKKRALVAVARKLGVLLHRLWVTAEVYEPLRNTQRRESVPAA